MVKIIAQQLQNATCYLLQATQWLGQAPVQENLLTTAQKSLQSSTAFSWLALTYSFIPEANVQGYTASHHMFLLFAPSLTEMPAGVSPVWVKKNALAIIVFWAHLAPGNNTAEILFYI